MRAIAKRESRQPPKSAKKAPREGDSEAGQEYVQGASRAGGNKLDAPTNQHDKRHGCSARIRKKKLHASGDEPGA